MASILSSTLKATCTYTCTYKHHPLFRPHPLSLNTKSGLNPMLLCIVAQQFPLQAESMQRKRSPGNASARQCAITTWPELHFYPCQKLHVYSMHWIHVFTLWPHAFTWWLRFVQTSSTSCDAMMTSLQAMTTCHNDYASLTQWQRLLCLYSPFCRQAGSEVSGRASARCRGQIRRHLQIEPCSCRVRCVPLCHIQSLLGGHGTASPPPTPEDPAKLHSWLS